MTGTNDGCGGKENRLSGDIIGLFRPPVALRKEKRLSHAEAMQRSGVAPGR